MNSFEKAFVITVLPQNEVTITVTAKAGNSSMYTLVIEKVAKPLVAGTDNIAVIVDWMAW